LSYPSFHAGAAMPSVARAVKALDAADQVRAARKPAATSGTPSRGGTPRTPSTPPDAATAEGVRAGLLGWLTFGSCTPGCS
jgi:hypothetical protein